ncbi:MAG: hypothetical protein H7329_01650 [Opitutaceae bacterium]|nr:hypothetical protein [Cytophagales bacterium]
MINKVLRPIKLVKSILDNYFVHSTNTNAEKVFIKKLSRYKIPWQAGKKELILTQALKDYGPCLSLAPTCYALAKKENANLGVYTVMSRLEENEYADSYIKYKLYTEVAYRKLDNIYLSYAGKVVYRNVFLHKNHKLINRHFNEIKQAIETKDDVIKLEIEGIKIGDLIYDTYLRFANKPTLDIEDPFLDKVIIQALHLYFNYNDLLKQYDVKALVHLYATYIHHGIIVRLCLKNNIPVYVVGAHLFIVKKLHQNFPSHANDHFLFHKIFEQIDNKSDKIQLAKKLFERRFTGKVDTAISYMRTNSFSNEQREEMNKYNWDKTVLVLAHCFFDSPHVYRSLLFPDFHEWLTYTLDTLKQVEGITVLVKPHPNGKQGNDEIFETFQEK